ncbi:MAG TPA: dual specificity protein phosphatase family protein [Bdellovibrionales bacterium]|nr:dual specificity protein phosphatase family protein [Bdellovibrionales bacterium]
MRRKYWLIALGVLALTAFILKNSIFRPAENFHVVDEGKFYRMAQPTAGEIEELVKKYGIKTIINLRGKQVGEWWYDNEKEATDRLGINQVDLPFSSEALQFPREWKKYLKTLETAERPILIHCRSGADRTSEAAAVYAMEYMGHSRERALQEQMSYFHLHVPPFQPAKTHFISRYQGAQWLKETYNPCSKDMRKYATDRCNEEALAKWKANGGD